MLYLQGDCPYGRAKEEEEIQRRSSACSQYPPATASASGDPVCEVPARVLYCEMTAAAVAAAADESVLKPAGGEFSEGRCGDGDAVCLLMWYMRAPRSGSCVSGSSSGSVCSD